MSTDDTTTQLTREDLQSMTPRQIVDAKKAGQLDELLGRKPETKG